MGKKKIGIIIGSLREGSFNRKIALNLQGMFPEGYETSIGEIGNLPLYNEDLDHENPPKEWVDFRKEVETWDGMIFVTPEYNRSMPAGIKNALDVGSRPYGKNMWAKKPGGIISSSTGGMGGFGSNHHLRQTGTFLDIYMMQQPERYLADISSSFDGDEMKDSLKKFLQEFVDAYIQWVENFN